MTAQSPDVILVGSRRFPLFSTPLEMLWSGTRPRPHFVYPHTGLYRGYIALWRIRNDSLWLLRIEGQVGLDETGVMELHDLEKRPGRGTFPPTRRFTRDDLFPRKKGPVLADWFTGELGIPEGSFVARETDFRDVFEREVRVAIEKGLIIRSQSVETGTEYRNKVAKRIADFARVLPVTPDDKGWAACPHCGKRFWVFGKNLQDGSTHRNCGGRLDVGRA